MKCIYFYTYTLAIFALCRLGISNIHLSLISRLFALCRLGYSNTPLPLISLLSALCRLGYSNTPLILEETAGSYGGGCENITDTFVSGT